MTRTHNRVVVASAWLFLIALSGCGADSDGSIAEQPVPVTPSSKAAQPTDAELTLSVDVKPEDLPNEYGSENLFGELGNRVDGYVTMDLCGADFPSEALRTARHQVAYSASNGDSISTETVAYEPGGAEQAMAELRGAVGSCPNSFVASKVAGQPAMKMGFEALPQEADWQEGSVGLRVTITPEKGPNVSGAVIYQTRGDIMAAVYVWAGPKTSPKLAAPLATLLSKRLQTVTPEATATS